jgi:fatty-acyl-CoA synthase
MQTYALTVDKFLDHAAKWFGDREIVEAHHDLGNRRTSYAALRERSNRMSGALSGLGLRQGDVVATLAWNTQHHLELYYAVMGAGLVCHTLNPRLSAGHLITIINEAQDRVLAVAADLLALWHDLAPHCPSVEHIIILDSADDSGLPMKQVLVYEELLEQRGSASVWGDFGEETPAGLCYTSGTTSAPKGVLYTHRSNYLHTLRTLQADAMALTANDVLLVGVPMFHANGWGLPFAAPAAGTKLVLPGRALDGASLAQLIRDEGVTIAVGVQTVWLGLADYVEANGITLPSLRRVVIGGSSCPAALIQRMETILGAEVQTSWGMTELSPTGTIAPAGSPRGASSTSGRPPIGIDLKLTDAQGAMLPVQHGVEGRLWVRGQSVIDRYFKSDAQVLDAEGYFDTGDLATIDTDGNLTINGRVKDLIKSGGEWINPTEIETVIGRHPAVRHVAVIARADARWGERPVLIVEADEGLEPESLLGMLRDEVADWWIPGEVARIAPMPLAATGKIDKARLRTDFAAGRITPTPLRR